MAYCLQTSRKRKRTSMKPMSTTDENVADPETQSEVITQKMTATSSATPLVRSPRIFRSRKNVNYRI